MIKKLRKERNLTKSELGKLSGVKKSKITKLEKGKSKTSLKTTMEVLKILKVEAKFVVEFDKNDKDFEIKNLETKKDKS
jgi:transcriptional regulator with XRE-family HTH domain